MGGDGNERSNIKRLPLGVSIILASLVFGSLRQGAYHLWQHQVFGFMVVVGGIAFLRFTSLQMTRRVSVVVVPLLVSSVLSTWFSDERSNASSTFVLIGLVLVAMLACGTVAANHETTVVPALVGVACLVAATAIWGVAFHTTPWGRITEGIWRGSSSLTYANAAAGILGPMTLLTMAKAANQDGRLYAVAGTLTAIGLISTQSRGGALAFVLAGALVLVHLGPRRFSTTAIPMLLGIGIGAPLLVLRAPENLAPFPVATMTLVVVGLGATALSWQFRHRLPAPHLLFFVGLPVCGLLAGLAGVGSALAPRLSLRSGTTFGGESANVLLGDRAKTWEVASQEFANHPLLGNGPGAVELRWEQGGRGFRAMFVHNEYLELAVTHGVVGLLALLVSVGLFVRYLRPQPSTAPFMIALVAFMAHSSLDFLWHIPMLPVFFASIAGVALGLSAHLSAPDSPSAIPRSTFSEAMSISEALNGPGGVNGGTTGGFEQIHETHPSGVDRSHGVAR